MEPARDSIKTETGLTAAVVGQSGTQQPPQSLRAHLLLVMNTTSGQTVPWPGWMWPPVAGFLQVQVWSLNIAAPSPRESDQLALEGLLAAFHLLFSLPDHSSTGTGGQERRCQGSSTVHV